MRADFVHHALVDEIEELRHAGEDTDPARRQRMKHRRRAHGLEKHDAGANRQREQQVRHLRKPVKQRQDAQDGVVIGHAHHLECCPAFRLEVGVREDHAFRIGGRAGGIQNHRGIVGGYIGNWHPRA